MRGPISKDSQRGPFAAGRKLFLLFMAGTLLVAPAHQSPGFPGRSSSPAQSNRQYITSEIDQAKMIFIPEGDFRFGVNPADHRKILTSLKANLTGAIYSKELPKQLRRLKSFFIDQYEVTNGQYDLFLKATGHREPAYWRYPQLNGYRQPVVGVGWADAEAYARWAGKRLPSEEEWEKAARGSDERNWPWGNTPDDTRYNGRKQAKYAPVNVGSFPQGDSPYGVSDMAGNVWEMTSGTWSGQARAMRGGSFLNINPEVRVTVRWAASDEDRGANWLGFRCVKDTQ